MSITLIGSNSEDPSEGVLYSRSLMVTKHKKNCRLWVTTLCCLISSPTDESRLFEFCIFHNECSMERGPYRET